MATTLPLTRARILLDKEVARGRALLWSGNLLTRRGWLPHIQPSVASFTRLVQPADLSSAALAHRSAINLMEWHGLEFRQSEGCRVPAVCGPKALMWRFRKFFSTLCSGGMLVFLDEWDPQGCRRTIGLP